MSIFSLIVARKKSKGLKDKVIQKIRGKYVFEYSIDYSLYLNTIIGDDVLTVVSSDSEIIEAYCKDHDIIFLRRTPELAADTSPIDPVIYDAYIRNKSKCWFISLLYGNIPTRYPDEFLRAYTFLQTHKMYDAVLSMQNVEKFNPAWMFELNYDSLPHKKEEGFRRQDLRQLMIHDGHTILLRSKHFIKFMEEEKPSQFLFESFGRKIKPMLNNKVIIDIDTRKDLKLAEAFLD